MKEKILIVSLFVCILLIAPIITANDTNEHTSYEVIENSMFMPSDTYKEIITIISGNGDGYKVNKWGIIRDVEMTAYAGATGLDIHVWIGSPKETFTEAGVAYIHAPCFIGWFTHPGFGYEVHGIAIGNIDWSK